MRPMAHLSERREGLAHDVELGLGLAAAEVGEGPRGVAEHGELRVDVQLREEGAHGVVAQHQVAALRRVAGDVAQRPHGLFETHTNTRSRT